MAARLSWDQPGGPVPPGYAVDRSRDRGATWEPLALTQAASLDVADHEDGDEYRVASLLAEPAVMDGPTALLLSDWTYLAGNGGGDG